MALVVENDEEEEKALKCASAVAGKSSSSSNVCEGKNETGKNKGKIIEDNDESST